MFNDKTIIITGGTGSFGNAFVKKILSEYDVKKIIVFSRDEMKQNDMRSKFPGESRIRYFLGDVRDKDRLLLAMRGVDFVVHAAALKIVPIAEEDPFECVKTNILGAMNVIEAALYTPTVKKVVALSTDKASSPINLYGATKLASDKLFSAANNLTGSQDLCFSVVRYGNVMGSRGSVIPLFLKLKSSKFMPITHPKMTRFMITLEQGIDLVVEAFKSSVGGEIYVKKIPSMKVEEIASAISPETPHKIIGVRPGEKLHESMISTTESPLTYEYDGFYKILPSWLKSDEIRKYVQGGAKVADDFEYNSNTNKEWMSKPELLNWVNQNVL